MVYHDIGKINTDINFFSTIHLQSFTFKESLARHHRKQTDNDLRLALELSQIL